MSISAELQKLVFDRLVANTAVHAICADRIYDRVPESRSFPYVSFGPSDQIEDDADCITGLVETMQIDCWSRYQGGMKEVKDLADTVRGALHLYAGEFATNALVELRVLSVRYFRDPDGLTSQAVLSIQAIMEEA
jgi:hypothetical protein